MISRFDIAFRYRHSTRCARPVAIGPGLRYTALVSESECPIDPARCPVCGSANDCGVAAGRTECWCFGVTMSPAALASIPDAARGRACLCAHCATSPAPETLPVRSGRDH